MPSINQHIAWVSRFADNSGGMTAADYILAGESIWLAMNQLAQAISHVTGTSDDQHHQGEKSIKQAIAQLPGADQDFKRRIQQVNVVSNKLHAAAYYPWRAQADEHAQHILIGQELIADLLTNLPQAAAPLPSAQLSDETTPAGHPDIT